MGKFDWPLDISSLFLISGRKYSQARGKSFVELNRKMNAERDASSERIKKQWDDPKKYVPVCECRTPSPFILSDFQMNSITPPMKTKMSRSKSLSLSKQVNVAKRGMPERIQKAYFCQIFKKK